MDYSILFVNVNFFLCQKLSSAAIYVMHNNTE